LSASFFCFQKVLVMFKIAFEVKHVRACETFVDRHVLDYIGGAFCSLLHWLDLSNYIDFRIC
jgi:hypothetical protein